MFLNHGDNTLAVGFDSYAKVAADQGLPLFSVDPAQIESQTLVALGPHYYQTGYEGGEVLARVLKGENPAVIPITQTAETEFVINLDTARQRGFPIAESLLQRATRVIDTHPAALSNR